MSPAICPVCNAVPGEFHTGVCAYTEDVMREDAEREDAEEEPE